MTAPRPGGSSPLELNYPDPRPPDLDLAAIIGRGRRIRHAAGSPSSGWCWPLARRSQA